MSETAGGSGVVNAVDALFQRSGIDPNDIQEIQRVNVWQGFYKDEDGEAQTVDMVGVQVRPKPKDIDSSLFVSQAAPTIINPVAIATAKRSERLTVCMGDAQIGFRHNGRDNETFHDERAMRLGLMAVQVLQPDEIVLTGDMVDLQSMSSFSQRPDWTNSTQLTIDEYHRFLAGLRANAPNAKITAVHGNHEERLGRYVRQNAAEMLGLRRANAEQELGVLTLPFLVRYDDLEVNGVTGYPNGRYWLEDNLQVLHGWEAKKGGKSADAYLRSQDYSTIFGHDHRLQFANRNVDQRVGHRVKVAASPGCLCKVEGSVPSQSHTVADNGETVKGTMDWQNGLLLVHHTERSHEITPVRMSESGDGALLMRIYDKVYEAGENEVAQAA